MAPRGKGRQTHINPDGFRRVRRELSRIFHTQADIPLTCLTLDGHRLDGSCNGAMQFDFELPDTLQIQFPFLLQSAAIAIAGESVAIKTLAGFEPRIPWLLPSFDAQMIAEQIAAKKINQ